MPSDTTRIQSFLSERAFRHLDIGEAAAALARRCETAELECGETWIPATDAPATAVLVIDGLAVLEATNRASDDDDDSAADVETDDPAHRIRALAVGDGFAATSIGARESSGKVPLRLVAALPTELLLLARADYESVAGDALPAFDDLLASLYAPHVTEASSPTDDTGADRDADDGPAAHGEGRSSLLRTRVREYMMTDLAVAAPDLTIRAVATTMRDRRISCMPVVEASRLIGIVTEADLAARVVAEGRSPDAPVREIMTADPLSVAPDDTTADVLRLLTERRIAHMPVVEDDRLVGILTQTDLVRRQTASPVYMVADIARTDSSAEIAEIVARIPQLLAGLIDGGADFRETAETITSIADAATVRLLELAEGQLGEPPVPYLWLACGSQGRREQTGTSDQDNCLMLHDDYDASQHGEYFDRLAHLVSDGLHEAGYVYCPGDMMATNDQWRQPVATWHGYFERWIERPDPEARMLASVMFDLRPIRGDRALYDTLQDAVLERAASNKIFVAHMAKMALGHSPPLGLFGRLSTERSGPHRGCLDLKHGGVVPIVDLARIQAFSARIADVNTLDRLSVGAADGYISERGARDLYSAYEVIQTVRLRHQARQVREQQTPDNWLAPASLSKLHQQHLRDAFVLVRDLQSSLSNRVATVG